MRDQGSDLETSGAQAQSRAGKVVAAVAGLLVAAGYLLVLVYLLSGKVIVDADVIIFCFLVCGVAAAIGFLFVYRLLPRREPTVLFAGTGVVPIQHPPRTATPTASEGHALDGTKHERREHGGTEPAPVMKSHGSGSPARYTTHEGAGVAAFVTVIGMAAILAGRLHGGWQFLLLALLAGLALALNWIRGRQQRSQGFMYNAPVGGGVMASASLVGMGALMLRFPGLRVFLLLALGVAGALVWYWDRRRRQDTRISIV